MKWFICVGLRWTRTTTRHSDEVNSFGKGKEHFGFSASLIVQRLLFHGKGAENQKSDKYPNNQTLRRIIRFGLMSSFANT